MQFTYSERAMALLKALFPSQLVLHKGDSRSSVLRFQQTVGGRPCDIFSVDGDHRYAGAKIDILNAVNATAVGGTIILDDMRLGGETRRAFEDARRLARLRNVTCVEGLDGNVSRIHRYDRSDVRKIRMSWCTGIVTQ